MEESILQDYLKAGKIAKEALDYGKDLIKVGAKLLDVTEAIEKKIHDLKGACAFPPQISINSIAAHYAAWHDDTTVFKQGDVVKLDIGVHSNGYVADTAVTVNLGDHQDIVDASREALDNALKIIRPGVTLSEIGKTIQETIESKGFQPIKNLSGHGLAQFKVHDAPSVPNYDTKDDTTLKEDDVIAIEPFATTGVGLVADSGIATIFSLSYRRSVRNAFTRDILKEIDEHGLPFSARELILKSSPGKVAFALRELKQLGCIHEYPPLKEKSNGIVSQAEHSVIVRDKPIVYTRD